MKITSYEEENQNDKKQYRQVLEETIDCKFCLINNNVCEFHKEILQKLVDRIYDL